MSWVAAGTAVVGGIISMSSAKKAERAAAKRAKALNAKLSHLEANRQAIINPYEGAYDLSGLIQDLSGEMTNPYANLSVATQAAEMEIEEADIALANTLDTLRATGSGAGGATALAQAAMKSKKGIAANIETQEAQNEKLRAQGEATLEQAQMAEKRRMQEAAFGEGQRMQGLDAAGKQFMFQQREGREMQQLDRISAQLSGAQANEAAARSDATAALTGTISAVGAIGAAKAAN
jgi:hypothetical protein